MAIGSLGPLPPPPLTLQQKIDLVGRKHRAVHSKMQQELDLNGFVYNMTDPESGTRIIRWLVQNGHLDSKSNFCDPFMGNGLLVHLVHVMTGVDSTGIEKDKQIYEAAVGISADLSNLGVIDPQHVHLTCGDCRYLSLARFNVFYLLPPWDDGGPDPMLVWDTITNMRLGAIMVLTHGINLSSCYYSPFRMERYVEKVKDIGGAEIYRRISIAP